MSRPTLRSRSPMLLFCAVLAASLLGAGCKQGLGDRCEVSSDCSSDYCSISQDPQNGICCDSNNLSSCMVGTTGSGGATGVGGSSGVGGETGSDAAADLASDQFSEMSTDATSSDASGN